MCQIICPGLTETGMTESAFEYARNRGTIGKVGQLNPLGRFAIAEGTQLEDMNRFHSSLTEAAFVQKLRKWLCSSLQVNQSSPPTGLTIFLDQSSYVNGQTLAVDGGHSASLPVMPGRWM